MYILQRRHFGIEDRDTKLGIAIKVKIWVQCADTVRLYDLTGWMLDGCSEAQCVSELITSSVQLLIYRAEIGSSQCGLVTLT